MKKLKTYQIDAFASEQFTGNPAAVCLLENWLPDAQLQAIAAANNLSETAFVLPIAPEEGRFALRWFTPTAEVKLCGHATLSAAHVLFMHELPQLQQVVFQTRFSGLLHVTRQGDTYVMDFPLDVGSEISIDSLPRELFVGAQPLSAWKGQEDLIVRLPDAEAVADYRPPMELLATLPYRGLITTAEGQAYGVDFVSRFFGPAVGVPEDPVTGSAHTSLAAFWAPILGKTHMQARQISWRPGTLGLALTGKRVALSGKALTFLVGEIWLQEEGG
ncbi:phenazine biosynthesis protein PhzF family [Nitritalea halalkaliphila LW7]|uniref:Phenazine biosynthesis protein PhzF family n=1 Tax=Nitritalea halalkaliphila LW7 TaxID=1189621 RepID=I5BTD9_9BACT|nr:PhzF family phenazine biosynthesis protein [Nitritalea halalkaliphila]EIM72841.1 phenazine biosynthesis protein PhzF family [Nitritalea halalkaliphila LW7]